MGAVKSNYGQRQSNQFKKRNQYWQEDGDVVFRILPISDRFTTDPYKWNQFHSVVKGYKNMEGKARIFESVLQKKNKEVVVQDAAVERFESLKAAHTKAVADGNGALAKQLNDLVGMRGIYGLDKKWYMNVMTTDGAIGTFAINYTAKAALDIEIERLNKDGVDPLSLENGRFFVFNRSNTGGKSSFSVRVLQEEVEVPGHGKLKKDVVSKISPEAFARIEQEMSDLETLYNKITPEEVAEIVKESDLKTGKSPACDRIFDARWKAKREANKASSETPKNSSTAITPPVVTSQPTVTGVTAAQPQALKSADIPASLLAPSIQAQTPTTAAQAPESQDVDGLSDADFFAQCGIEV